MLVHQSRPPGKYTQLHFELESAIVNWHESYFNYVHCDTSPTVVRSHIHFWITKLKKARTRTLYIVIIIICWWQSLVSDDHRLDLRIWGVRHVRIWNGWGVFASLSWVLQRENWNLWGLEKRKYPSINVLSLKRIFCGKKHFLKTSSWDGKRRILSRKLDRVSLAR